MNERYLIINADDFGIHESADKAILHLLEEQRITSVSLMGPGARSAEAVKTAASQKISAGVHWTLSSDWENDRWHSVSPEREVFSLCDEQGLLHDAKLLAKQAKSRQVTAELTAQVNYMLQNGCPPDHADSHCGTLYGTNGRLFFLNAFRVCKKYNLPFRMPRRHDFLNDQFKGKAPRAVYALHSAITGTASLMGVDLIDDLITNPYSIKDIPNDRALRDYYLRRVASLKEGITEMFLHPAYSDPELLKRSREWAKREMEYRFLQSDDLLNLALKEDICLISWRNAPFRNKNKKEIVRNNSI